MTKYFCDVCKIELGRAKHWDNKEIFCIACDRVIKILTKRWKAGAYLPTPATNPLQEKCCDDWPHPLTLNCHIYSKELSNV